MKTLESQPAIVAMDVASRSGKRLGVSFGVALAALYGDPADEKFSAANVAWGLEPSELPLAMEMAEAAGQIHAAEAIAFEILRLTGRLRNALLYGFIHGASRGIWRLQ